MRFLFSALAFLYLTAVFSGCSADLSQAELETMSKMNAGWQKDLQPFRDIVQAAAVSYSKVTSSLQDTSNYNAKLYARDSLFQAKLKSTQTKYQKWYAEMVANLTTLNTLILQNQEWMLRLQPRKTALKLTRRSWDSRRAQFYTMFSATRSLGDQFPAIQKEWQPFARQLGVIN